MRLRSFEREPPSELAVALRVIADLPTEVRAKLAELIPEVLELMPEDQLDNRIVRHCRKLELDPARLAPPLKSARFLFRIAASNAASPEDVAADLEALVPGVPLAEWLVPLYEAVLPALRQEIAMASLAAHGKVLSGIEWRIDAIAASNRGRGIQLPVAMLTFDYRDRNQPGSVTLQLLPSMVKELRDVCERLLATDDDASR
ncbi:MAG: hypothetical protein FJ095_12590 [Deltaproteobacteria bacterium]|nr:hypothetical protein [Deltaproteobacteria bacterium]